MQLHWSPRSPFVRKVMIVLHETGLTEQVSLVRSVVGMPLPPNQAVMADNPLGKIPTLVTAEGQALFDSRVICEYLDTLSGTGLVPDETAARMQQLTWQALGDGLTDILLLWRTELTRDSGPWEAVTSGFLAKVRATMARLEHDVPALRATRFGVGHIAVICALGQMDFRWPDCAWRTHFPTLAAWEAEMAKRPSIAANAVVNDQEGGAESDVTSGQIRF